MSMRINSRAVHRWCVHFIISVTDIQCYSAIQCCRQTVLLLQLWLLRLKVMGVTAAMTTGDVASWVAAIAVATKWPAVRCRSPFGPPVPRSLESGK